MISPETAAVILKAISSKGPGGLVRCPRWCAAREHRFIPAGQRDVVMLV
jgi:hypothetical protein